MPGKKPLRAKESTDRGWSLKEIQDLIDVLVERKITEFEMEQSGLRVRIKRGDAQSMNPGAASLSFAVPASPAPAPAGLPLPVGAAEASPAPVEASTEAPEGLHLIKSPIVGTFYSAPAPNAPPFVKLGDVVQVGQVLCVIEAMKLMNEIESEVAGELVRVYVENGQPVEYGQSLFAIKPSHKK